MEAQSKNPSPNAEFYRVHYQLVARAAIGDIEAQRETRNLALDAYANGSGNPITSINWAVIMARLAAAHGNRADRMALASTLCFFSAMLGDAAPEDRDDTLGEAIAIMDELADGSDQIAENAGLCLQQYSHEVSPEVLRWANELRGIL